MSKKQKRYLQKLLNHTNKALKRSRQLQDYEVLEDLHKIRNHIIRQAGELGFTLKWDGMPK